MNNSSLFLMTFERFTPEQQKTILIDLLNSFLTHNMGFMEPDEPNYGLLYALDQVFADDPELCQALIKAVNEDEEYFSYYDI